MITRSCDHLLPLFLLLSCVASQKLSADHEAWMSAVTKIDQISRITRVGFSEQLSQIVSSDSIALSHGCRHELGNYSTGLRAGHDREVAMFDSYSKIHSGLMTFRGYDMGAYQQCLDLGRYVYLGIKFPLPSDATVTSLEVTGMNDWRLSLSKQIGIRRLDPFHFGLCVPDSCTEADLLSLFSSPDVIKLIDPLSVEIRSTDSRSDPVNVTISQVLAILILLGIFHLGLAASAATAFLPGGSIATRLQPFDVWINLKELFSSNTRSQSMYNNSTIYRTLYLFAGIFSHMPLGVTWAATLIRPEASAAVMANHLTRFDPNNMMRAAVPITLVNNWLPAGIFATIKWVPVMRKNSVTFAAYALDRVFRTLPVIMAMLLIYHILPLAPLVFGAGPLTKYTLTTITGVCNTNGWKELLFINNFGDMRQICMPVAWFMSAEFQLYCASFITFRLISKYPARSKHILAAQFAIGLAASGLLYYVTRVPAVVSFRTADLYDMAQTFPIKMYHTLNYLTVYTISIVIGLRLLEQENKPQPIPIKAWAACALGFNVLIGMPVLLYFNEEGRYDSSALGPIAEAAWTICGRPMMACFVGVGFYGLINLTSPLVINIASSRFAVVCTKLTLCFFMMHSFVVILLFASYEVTVISNIQMFMEYVFILIVSFPLACLLHIFVEVPFAKVLASIIRRPQSESVTKAE